MWSSLVGGQGWDADHLMLVQAFDKALPRPPDMPCPALPADTLLDILTVEEMLM